MKLGALEAGGTKMVCAVGDENGTVYEQTAFPTRTPEQTVPEMISYFRDRDIDALGIGCFGPVELDEASPHYGTITSTPKTAWQNYPMAETFARALHCLVGFDTDVNAAVLGEVTFGRARGMECAVYLTVGTGIGAGIYVNGGLLHGMMHPEAGHVPVRRRSGDTYRGGCPWHDCCLEGMASGPAIEERWGCPAARLADRPEVWELEADYIAQALAGYILTLSPQVIVLGGGVMQQRQLFPLIRDNVARMLGGYLQAEALRHMEDYIVPSALEGRQGILGCLELARRKAAGPEKGENGTKI